MRRLVILCIGIIALVSCREEEVKPSGINVSQSASFQVTSIQPGTDGDILCIGTHVGGADSTYLYRYSSDLQLKEVINLFEQPEFEGELHLTCMQDRGWIMTRITTKQFPRRVYIIKTDEHFNVEHQYALFVPQPWEEAWLYGIQGLQDGSYMASVDFKEFNNLGEGHLIHFSSNLSTILSDSSWTKEHAIHFVELPDGDIVYSSFRYDAYSLQTLRRQSKNGELRWVREDTVHAAHAGLIGLSWTGKDVLTNYIINDEHKQFYGQLDGRSGIALNSSILPTYYLNHQIEREKLQGSHFPTGPANPLPAYLKPSQGHVIYSEADRKLYFLEVNERAEVAFRFIIPTPPFDKVYSYRQLFLNNGTVIVGVSYRYKGTDNFSLVELTMDGSIVNE